MRHRCLAVCLALRLVPAASLLGLASCTAPDLSDAPAVAESAQSPDEAGAALAVAFAQLCLARFPEQDDLAEGGTPQGTRLTPMSEEQAQRFLHLDPGRGWTYSTPYGEYVVTVEDPPYRTCAVRRRYAEVPRFNVHFQAVSRRWASEEGRGGFTESPPFQQRRPNMRVMGRAMLLPASAGRPAEVFMEIATIYRDGQVEVRFVRQIPDPEARDIRRT